MVDHYGRFAWYELITTDPAGAKAFYTHVVGWSAQDASTSELAYTLVTSEGAPLGGLMDLPEEARKMGATPRWMGYVSVKDADAAADRIKRLGGAVYVPPTDSNIGRISVVADPQTATLGLVKGLKPGEQQPADLGKPGRVGWHELHAADWERALAFYGELFGWQKAGADIGLTGHVSVVLRRWADGRRHVHQTSGGSGSILAFLFQYRRYRRGGGAREDRWRPGVQGPA